MKWRAINMAAMLALAGGVVWQNGCGGSGANQVAVTVSPSTATVIANTVQTLTATVTGSDTTTSTFTCSYVYTPNPTTQNPNPSQVGPIDNCTSGQKVAALGGGSLGTWTQTPNSPNNVLTYTAPTLSNFPNPIPTITFTAAATANTGKKATGVLALDTGIRTALSPATATVPTEITPAQTVQFTPNFLNVSPANANPQWLVTQPVSGNTTKFPQGTTPVPQDVSCSPSCGTISAQGVFTAPATQPTNTSPVGAGSEASSLAPIVYVVCWSASDINHYAIATITLVEASQNPITFSGIQPTTIAAGGVLQDVWLNAHNLLNTSQITFTPPGPNQAPQVIPSTNIFTVPITSAYCTPSASGVTPVVTCDASIITRIRLTQSQLASAGTGTITVSNIPDASTGGTQAISYPINLVYANPQVTGAVPDSYPQGTSTDFSADGGYFGLGTSPLVQLLFNGQANVNIGTGNPRQITGFLPGSSAALNGPGLYPVSVVSSTPQGSVPFPLVSTDVAVQPTFQSGSASLNSVYFIPGTSTTPQVQQAYPPNISFPAVAGVSNLAPSGIAIDSVKGYAAVTLQGANAVQIINLVSNGSGRFMPQMAAQIAVGNQPTSIAIDNQINLTNYPGQDLGVVVNSADYTLTLMALPSGSIIGSPISLKGLIAGGPTGLAAPTPYAVGIDPTTHYGFVAFSNAYVGFIVDLNPNASSTQPTCFVSSQTPPCALVSVSMNTGATPQVVMQPGVPVAYVMPGGTGVMSVVNLLATNNTVTIAASPNGITCTNDIVTVTTPTVNGLNPASPGSVLITGATPASYNGTYNVLSVPTSYTFTYEYNGTSCPSATTGGGGTVTYGNPYYTFGTSPTIVGVAVNSISKYLAFADPAAATSAPQIGFVSALDQTVSSLYLSQGSCVNCSPIPSGAPEVGLRWVSWDPYRNVLVAFNPGDNYNQISLISPPTISGEGSATSPTRLIQAISTGNSTCAAVPPPGTPSDPSCQGWAPAQGTFTPAGSSTAVTVYGPMVYDPMTNLVLVANAGTNSGGLNTLNYLDIDPQSTFKPVNIGNVLVTSGGVASAQPPLASSPNAPNPLPKAVCDPSSPTNIYATCFPQAVTIGQSATLRILGQGFTSSGTPVVQLDNNSTGVTITNATDTEVDVTIAASVLTQPHQYALQVITSSGNGISSNTVPLYAVGVISLSSLCSSAVMPEAAAVDDISNVGVISNYGCNSVSFINLDSKNAHNYGVPYGALLATVNVGHNPIGVDMIPRLGYAVVANNADASASVIRYGGSPFTATQLAFTSTTCTTASAGVTTTNICTGVSPVGVAIDQDRALALIANNGGNSLTALDLTPLLLQTSSGCTATNQVCTPASNLVAASGPPIGIAVDPNRDEAVVTNTQNAGTTSVTGGLDVISLSTSPPTKTTTASISSLTANPTGIVYDPAATSGSCSTPCTSSALFYVSSTQQNAIYTFDPDSSSTSLIRVGINPFSLGYNYQTGALVTTNSTANTMSVVDAVNAPTFATRATLGISSQSQFALAIDSFTNTAIMVDQNNDRVMLIPVH